MKLKHGKKYETADGVVYRVRKNPDLYGIWDVCDDTKEHWDEYGKGCWHHPDLIRRHYTKPQPAHKLDLKPGDVVEWVGWEDGSRAGVGRHIVYDGLPKEPKGDRPLFRVVSRASCQVPPS